MIVLAQQPVSSDRKEACCGFSMSLPRPDAAARNMSGILKRPNNLSSQELRKRFLDFFRGKGHLILPSASLIPKGDKTLLLTGAGMVPFKPYFLGTEVPPSTRISTCQRCLRTADIDNVGKTARHCTFFEMLGNFSFGDYFKDQAIPWAWEFVTQGLGFDPGDLWVTIYLDDDEAFEIWNKVVGIPAHKIVRLGKDTNFWEIGVGPCGPCSEIFVDRGPEHGCGKPDCGVECDCDRFMEIWNLVFIQFRKDEEGNYHLLGKKSIDTGMGLERVSAILQGVETVFETDLFEPIIASIAKVSGKKYGEKEIWDRSFRVITDHMRGVTFLVSDGVVPSNEGRGYVLRRLLRRAVRHGRLIGIDKPFLAMVAEAVMGTMSSAYPELTERHDHILRVIEAEESRFMETLEQGTSLLNGLLQGLKANGEDSLPGADAFRLYDTYGFPYELTEEICHEAGVSVDHKGFLRLMNEQRERARAARQTAGYLGDMTSSAEKLAGVETRFIGYDVLTTESEILKIFGKEEDIEVLNEGEVGQVLLDRTPFYAESGGQVADEGVIEGPKGVARVKGAHRIGGAILHEVAVERGSLSTGDLVTAHVDRERRLSTARNHTSTHLLHSALRKVLGEHVFQSGSLVAPDRLRFDFSSSDTPDKGQLSAIEDAVNEMIRSDLPVETFETSLEDARKMGAMALFGEKYGDRVRVVRISDVSLELCGGTHLMRTGQIGIFKILGATSIAAGVKRIDAVTGPYALAYVRDLEAALEGAASQMKSTYSELPSRVALLLEHQKELEKEIASLRSHFLKEKADRLVQDAENINGVRVLVGRVEGLKADELRTLGDLIRDRLGSGVLVIGSRVDGHAGFIAMASKDLTSKGVNAGEIVRTAARAAGGGGGGKPEIAEAGARNVELLDAALDAARIAIQKQLGSFLQ